MAQPSTQTFEKDFNNWYKTFLEEEQKFNEQVKTARKEKEEKVKKAREEAISLIRNYEEEQRENLDSMKKKVSNLLFQISLTYNKSEDLDKNFDLEKEEIKKQFDKNRKNVINFLVETLLEVNVELPESLKKKSKK